MTFLTLAAATAASFVCAAPIAVDGDTLRCGGGAAHPRYLVRLLGIDAPELPGHCRAGRVCTPGDGAASTRAMAALIAGGTVVCAPQGRDSYGRVLASCSAGGVELSCAMVARGFAVERYSRLRCK